MEPTTWITESDHIGGKVIGWVRAKSVLLLAILCVGGPAAVLGQGPTLYGQVILEDGTPVSEFILVEMVCNGLVIQQAFTGEEGVCLPVTITRLLGSPKGQVDFRSSRGSIDVDNSCVHLSYRYKCLV